ncbi:MAG: ABC transporter substrate-binding protein, partial [Oscillospiraceae bacterium]|nr:ABC transporter substrate-binding protein [Oscillospiraceae bacterium]
GRSDDVRPLIAQSWDVSEDYLTWTFQIREGVRFTDGTQCDAAAVDAAWDCFYSMYPSYFTNLNVVNWEATGEYELTLQLSSPCARLESELAKLYVLSPEALAQYGLEDNRSAVGTAPYYVSEAPTEPLTDYRNLEYVFKANEDYYLYERMPVIETIVVKCVLENKTMEDMLFSGELDAYTFSYRYNEAFYERLCSEFDGTVLKSCPSGSPIFFKAHLVPELQIFEVRKAINRFIDLEALNKEIYGGFGLVQSSVWSVGSSGEVPWPEGFYYSPEEGHELMAAAGLDTVGFTFKTTTTASGAELEIIKRQLAEGGINMELYVHPVESSFSYLPDEEIVSVGSPGYSNATPYDPWNFILLPDSLLRLVRSDVYDPELYAAMCDTYDEMLSSFTWDEMLEKSKTLTDMLQKDYGALPGVQAPSFAAFSKRLKGIVYISEQHVLLWNYLYL